MQSTEDEGMGKRKVPFNRELYIEREDFMEDPPKNYYRLSPGREVRLRYAYYIKCTDVVKNAGGEITEIHCTYDPETKGGSSPDKRKVQGTIHWVSYKHALDAEIRLYDRLFTKENPDEAEEGKDFKSFLNPDSLKIVKAKVEPSLRSALPGSKLQFERIGYFCTDKDSGPDKLIFNRTVTLKDSWAKEEKKNK
jgi:glutaminyl-tRNA synthetase